MEPVPASDAEGVIVSHEEVADDFRYLQIEGAGSICRAQPGQFVQLLPVGATSTPLLRIPLSISDVDEQTARFGVLYDIVGPKTQALSRLRVGERVSCLGPLGHPFPQPPPEARPLLVGGGIGVPPLIHLGNCLQRQGLSPVLIVGARHRGKHLPESLLATASNDIRQATDDGSLGHHGFVTDLLETAIPEQGTWVVYTCGPHPMMAAVAAACDRAGIRCYASLEEYMACGIGVCVGCVVELAAPATSPYGQFTRVCVDGPVDDAREIVW
mgnify:FL=1